MKIIKFLTAIAIIFHGITANAKWDYSSETVGIDELTRHVAVTARVEKNSKDTPYKGKDKATLSIINNPDEEDAISILLFYLKGNSICGQFETTCKVKFDDNPSFSVNFKSSISKNSSLLWVESYETNKFLEKIFSHKKLKVEIKYLTENPSYLEFNIADLDQSKFLLPREESNETTKSTEKFYLNLEQNESTKKSREIQLKNEKKLIDDKIASKIIEEEGIDINFCKRWPDNAVLKLDSIITKIPSSSPIPIYPPLSKRESQQGTAIIKFVVTSAGNTENHQIISSTGHKRLDDAALDAIKLWKFTPAVAEGKNLNCWALQRFNFSLN